MKIFIIKDGVCDNNITKNFTSKQEAAANLHYDMEDMIVEAPDDIFNGCLYDGVVFTKPVPPEGMEYDKDGNLYPIGMKPQPQPDPTILMQAKIQAQADRIEFLEDVIAEMAMQVYSEESSV